MSQTQLPTSLTPALSDRDAISDAVIRACLAIDTDDESLFQSAFTQDAIFEIESRPIMKGYAAIKTDCFDVVAKLDTTHFLSNMRVNIESGGSAAKLTCSAHSFHYRKGEGVVPDAPKWVGGTLYFCDLVKEEAGGWKISNWYLKPIWLEGDISVMGFSE